MPPQIVPPQPLNVLTKALAHHFGYDLAVELPPELEWLGGSVPKLPRLDVALDPLVVCVHDFTGDTWALEKLAPLITARCIGVRLSERMVSECDSLSCLAARYLHLFEHLTSSSGRLVLVGYSFGACG